MISSKINILLADDDNDDCLFFKEALDELPLSTSLTTIHDGEQLIELLTNGNNELPHVLFLDLNMPRKNGFECLIEIRHHKKLRKIPIIILSTSSELYIVNLIYNVGAQYYIRKPIDFSHLKKVIYQALILSVNAGSERPAIENFILRGDAITIPE